MFHAEVFLSTITLSRVQALVQERKFEVAKQKSLCSHIRTCIFSVTLMKGCAAAFPAIKDSKWPVISSEQREVNSNNAFKLWGIY